MNDGHPYPLPHNIEAEAALLGGLMMENRLVDSVADKLMPQHFYEQIHARIYSAILRETALGRRANPVTLKPFFVDDVAMKEVGGPAYLAQLTGSSAAIIGVKDFAKQIFDLAQLRTLVGVGRNIADWAGDTSVEVDPVKLIERAEAELHRVAGVESEGVDEATISEAMQQRIEEWSAKAEPGVQIRSNRSLAGGLGLLRRKHLTICAARPGMGKTALAICLGLDVANNRTPDADELVPAVLFFSLEMPKEEIGARAIAGLCFDHPEGPLDYSHIEAGTLPEDEKRRAAATAIAFKDMPFYIYDVGRITIGRLERVVRRYKRKCSAKGQHLALVIVDYLQLVDSDRTGDNRSDNIGQVSRGLKGIAKTHNTHVFALAQLNREVEKREDKTPKLSDLRDSGSIEQDADNVLFLVRPEYYLGLEQPNDRDLHRRSLEDACGKLNFIFAKRRGGKTGVATGRFYGAYQAVR